MIKKQQAGFSLIEVLVATVIMAVGILGVAGLQVISLQQNRSSLLRSEALQIGNDIIDRMRANPTEDYEISYSDPPPSSASNCFGSSCTQSEMALFDLAQWKCAINPVSSDGETYAICTTLGLGSTASSMPDGEGEVAIDSGVQTVRVRWADGRDGAKGTVVLTTRADG